MTNLINVQANKIGLVQGSTINDINDIFVEKSQIKSIMIMKLIIQMYQD